MMPDYSARDYVPSAELGDLPEACQEAMTADLLPALFSRTVAGAPTVLMQKHWVIRSLRAEVERLGAEIEGADAGVDEARADALRLTGADRARASRQANRAIAEAYRYPP
jgi:hypothetical protein